MPRPGPRPFECIRRAWHSDSHQLLRGTLIHEIFRLVNELHSTSTRRKKEWQEKLPIVVLRAEEILYSKANSEGEYADVKTLRSRLDDAVNTMIRREDSEEDGVYLVPCVEAALSLGCTPKKGTRGQRQGSSRHFLNAARRASPTARPATNEDSTAVAMSMESVRTSHDKHSSSSISLMSTQVLPVQEQDFQLVAHRSNSSVFTPVSAFWGPASGYPSNANIIPLQNSTFNKSPDVSHPAGASSFPKPGALVQFLRTTDGCRFPGLPIPDALYALPQACFNVNQGLRPLQILDSAESSGARMGSRLPCADESMCAPCNPPNKISRLPQDVSRDSCIAADQQYRPRPGAVIASSLDSTSCVAVRNALPFSSDRGSNSQLKEFLSLPGGGHGNSTSVLPNLCKSYKTETSQRNISGALSGVDDNSASLSDVHHDLQLRLGPPVNEHYYATSDDAPAPKRMRVAVIDPSRIQLL